MRPIVSTFRQVSTKPGQAHSDPHQRVAPAAGPPAQHGRPSADRATGTAARTISPHRSLQLEERIPYMMSRRLCGRSEAQGRRARGTRARQRPPHSPHEAFFRGESAAGPHQPLLAGARISLLIIPRLRGEPLGHRRALLGSSVADFEPAPTSAARPFLRPHCYPTLRPLLRPLAFMSAG